MSTLSASHICPLGERPVRSVHALGLVLLAACLWWLLFGVHIVNFWLGMSVAATTLALLSVCSAGWPAPRKQWTVGAALCGIGSAGVLYGIFWIGHVVAGWLFAFAPEQVASIYTLRHQSPAWTTAVVLLCITSPAEEIFWRGYVQRWCAQQWGSVPGWLAGAAIYAAVHMASGNVMLVLAALVAGLFWGLLYRMTGNLAACIISHAVWTVTIFVLAPIM